MKPPRVLVPYDPPIQTAAQVRKIAVSMHFAAYNGLGFRYKLSQGFYTGAAKQAWTHMPARVRAALAGSALSVLLGLVYARMRRPS